MREGVQFEAHESQTQCLSQQGDLRHFGGYLSGDIYDRPLLTDGHRGTTKVHLPAAGKAVDCQLVDGKLKWRGRGTHL
jgi:hypothetical protein